MEQSVRSSKLLKYINEIERLIVKYNLTPRLPEVSECKALLTDGKYLETLSRINTSKWWGESSIADIYLTSTYSDEIPRDMAILETNLFRIACLLEDEGIYNKDAQEVVFQLSSWGYKVD